MAKKTIDKDTNVTTVNKIEETKVVSEQKEDNVNVMDLDKIESTDKKKDVSEVVTPDTDLKNVETPETPENAENTEKQETPAEMVNESEQPVVDDAKTDNDAEDETDKKEAEDLKESNDKDDEEGYEGYEEGYSVDTPALSELIDPEANGSISTTPTYVACPPIKESYVYAEATPVYEAQCPPKPDTEKPDAYVAQRPY